MTIAIDLDVVEETAKLLYIRALKILPDDIKLKLDWNKDVFGDFLVCPLSKGQPGRMQTICLESGKHLTVREHKLVNK